MKKIALFFLTFIFSTKFWCVKLLSTFSTSYIYGKKQINVIFNKDSLLSLGKIFIYLVISILISLVTCLNDTKHYIVLISFIFSLSLIFYMMFKIMIFYTHPFFYKKSVNFHKFHRHQWFFELMDDGKHQYYPLQ